MDEGRRAQERGLRASRIEAWTKEHCGGALEEFTSGRVESRHRVVLKGRKFKDGRDGRAVTWDELK